MNALRPVAQSVPAGARTVDRHFYEPVWDSCDGQRSTFGWDDVTVDVGFNSNGLPDDTIFTHIERVLASQGWTYEPSDSATGAWYWGRRLPNGRRASIQLLGGADSEPHNPWDLQATTAPATHPVRGC
jgi:hypothetical protein